MEFTASINFRFSDRVSQSQLKLAKKIIIFQDSFAQETHSFFESQLTQHCKKILLQYSRKPYPVYKFTNKHVSGVCQKFLNAQELHSQSIWKANICIFLYISVIKFLFQIRRNFLSGGGLNNFLKPAGCLGLVIFYFNQNFWKFSFFSISIRLSIALKCWNSSDNLDFNGNIVANFLIKSQYDKKTIN